MHSSFEKVRESQNVRTWCLHVIKENRERQQGLNSSIIVFISFLYVHKYVHKVVQIIYQSVDPKYTGLVTTVQVLY